MNSEQEPIPNFMCL